MKKGSEGVVTRCQQKIQLNFFVNITKSIFLMPFEEDFNNNKGIKIVLNFIYI